MRVTVTRLDGGLMVSGYDPEHFAGVNLYFAGELAQGLIAGYVIERDGCYSVPVFA